MHYIISISLSLLVIVAGMVLLAKTNKDALGKAYTFVSYAVITIGILLASAAFCGAFCSFTGANCNYGKVGCHGKNKCYSSGSKCASYQSCQKSSSCGSASACSSSCEKRCGGESRCEKGSKSCKKSGKKCVKKKVIKTIDDDETTINIEVETEE